MTDTGDSSWESWVTPEIMALKVNETQARDGRGRDGGFPADCTRS